MIQTVVQNMAQNMAQNMTQNQTLKMTQPKPLAESLVRALFIGATVMAMGAALVPNIRQYIKDAVISPERRVLSTMTGDVMGESSVAKIVKVQTADGLFIEVYSPQPGDSEQLRLVQRIPLADKTDGYFVFNGEATSMAIDDVDGDQKAEIIVPSFDQNMVAHLSVFSYSKVHHSFIMLSE